MKHLRTLAVAGVAVAAVSTLAWAAGNYSTYPIVGSASFCASTVSGVGGLGGTTGQGQGSTGSICAQTIPAGPTVLTGSELVPADTAAGANTPVQSVTIPAALLANMSGTPRNYLDNGSMNVQQRGTGTVTCGTTTVPSTAYGPDRWGCHANVTSGAGRQAIVTTAALLPAGFASVNTVWRNSGALTQPVCSTQIIPTTEATALAGKQVTLSFYATALAGLAADNSNVITASIFTGTGSDQGFGTLTASPAITPAWTGLASPISQTAITITTTPTRYSVTGTIGSTVTELGVAICFTPTATGSGVTDGFAFTGVQLEVAPSPTAYEFHPFSYDLARAQRFFYRLSESAAVTPVAPCAAVDTTHTNCLLQFPQTLRAAPTMTYTAGFASPTTTSQATLGACSALATASTVASTAANSLNVLINCTATTIPAAGIASFLYSNNGSGVISASADF
jgi:hypothetical protein